MITGIIQNQAKGGALVVTLPCDLFHLREHLASIGILSEWGRLLVGGTDTIQVQLKAEEPIGELVLSKLEQGDTLISLNMACQKIQHNCPFGYDEFMDMLTSKKDVRLDRFHFYQQYIPYPPSAAIGVKHLIEETDRYRLTMENYARACKAAEDEEYEMSEGVNLER